MTQRSDLSRLDELEARQAFQDEAVASLNEALVNQQQRIAQLEKVLELTIERYRQSETDIAFPSEEPPPPHY